MSARDFLLSNQRWFWLFVAVAYCGWQFHYALTEYNRRGHDPWAVVGAAGIDLAQLNYALQYADLQSVGLFVGTDCEQCDFSHSRYMDILWSNDDHHLFGVLGQVKNRLDLAFYYYGEDMVGARKRFDQSLERLRAKYPGRSDAISGGSLTFKGGLRPGEMP